MEDASVANSVLLTFLLSVVFLSTFCLVGAQNIETVTLLESGNGVVRINENLVFTCTITWKTAATSRTLKAINLQYGQDEGTEIPISYDFSTVSTAYLDAYKGRANFQILPESSYKFTIDKARLSDQQLYYCRPYDGFSQITRSPPITVEVQVPPSEPVFELSNTATLVVGQQLKITCWANTGKPKGNVLWYRTIPPANEEQINSETSMERSNNNGTVVVTTTYTIQTLARADNGASYRCAATNPSLRPVEEKPTTTIKLNVQFGVDNLQVAHDSTSTDPEPVIFTSSTVRCTAEGNPSPTVSWTKVSGKGDLVLSGQTIVVGTEAELGKYTYRCSAVNQVDGVDSSKTKEFTFEVQARPTTPPTTPTPRPPATTKKPGGNTGQTTAPLNTAGLIGGVVGAILALIIIVIIVVCVCRKKKKGMLDDDAEKGKNQKAQGFDNGPVGGFDVEMDDGRPYDSYSKNPNGNAFPIDTVDNTPGSRKGFHVPAEPSYEPAYM